jgi:hypothetical protein
MILMRSACGVRLAQRVVRRAMRDDESLETFIDRSVRARGAAGGPTQL